MIIVEGPDGSGKSTLVARLEEQLEIDREPRAVSSDARSLIPIGKYIETELRRGFGLRLYDRFALISSPRYMSLPNPTYRDELLDRVWLVRMSRLFTEVDPAIILCLPPYDVVQQNVVSDPTSEVMYNHLYQIYWGYHDWYCHQKAAYNTSVLLWDYTNPDEKGLDGLIRWAQARAKVGGGKTWRTASS